MGDRAESGSAPDGCSARIADSVTESYFRRPNERIENRIGTGSEFFTSAIVSTVQAFAQVFEILQINKQLLKIRSEGIQL